MKYLVLVVAACAILGVAGSGVGASARHRIPEGLYGGEHASLRVFAKGAEIDLECAHGFVTKTMRVNHDGTFDIVGTLSTERGPMRGPDRPVRVTGTLTGSTLVFTVRDEPFEPGSAEYGPFTVTLGEKSSYAKCM